MIAYYGYDFLNFNSQQNFTADLQYANGEIVKHNFGFVAIPHNYELTLDIQAVSYDGVDRTRGPKIVLKWGNSPVQQSELSVQFPPPVPTLTPIPPPYIQKFTIEIATGNDNLRSDSKVYADLSYRDPNGSTAETSRFLGSNWGNNSKQTIDWDLPTGIQFSDLIQFSIVANLGVGTFPDGPDNWDMQWIYVTYQLNNGTSPMYYKNGGIRNRFDIPCVWRFKYGHTSGWNSTTWIPTLDDKCEDR